MHKPSTSKKKNLAMFLAMGGAIAFPCSATLAQIVPDTTLPVNSVVTSSGNALEITGGTRAGGNLFHSFGQFSVPTGDTAFFNNASDIQNIVSRVTGGSISNIDGLIRANGAANLFLINPNGIIFGPNAQLNIGGSFLASTANSVEFADGSTYSATNPQAPPLLTVNVPIGLQFGQNPGSIRVQGPVRSPIEASSIAQPLPEGLVEVFLNQPLSIPPQDIVSETTTRIEKALALTLNTSQPGLQVNSGKTLALVGGDVTLESGILRAGGNSVLEPGGRIELGSVGSFGRVNLATGANGWILGYESVPIFRDIRLLRQSTVNLAGDGSGEIQMRCDRCTISDNSAIFAEIQGDRDGGELSIKAKQLNIESSSIVGSASADLSTGKSSDINVETGSLTVRDAFLGSLSFSQGNAGQLTVKATDLVTLSGTLFDGRLPAGIFGAVAGNGNGGNLTIETRQFIARDGAQVAVTAVGTGTAGKIQIKASESVELIGESADSFFRSGIFASSFGTGAAGDLTVETSKLSVSNGAAVSAVTGEGSGGKVVVRSSDLVEIFGSTAYGLPTDVSTITVGSRKAGDLQIDTANLIVRDGGQVTASTNGGGDGGTVEIRASTVELIGISPNSQLIPGVLARSFANGKAGDVRIFAEQLIVRNGAQITVDSDGLGAAGNLSVEAGSIRLDNGKITAETRSGDRGNITLQASYLQMRNNSNITTNAMGDATGGNIAMNLDILAALENSDISADSNNNFGGQVDISALGIFLQGIDGTQVKRVATPFTSDITAKSELGLQFDGVVNIKTPDVDPTSGIAALPQDVAREPIPKNACTVSGNRSTFVDIGRGGLPPDFTEILNLDLVNESHSISSRQIVEATGMAKSPDGKVHLVARSPVATPNNFLQISVSCTLSPHYPSFRR